MALESLGEILPFSPNEITYRIPPHRRSIKSGQRKRRRDGRAAAAAAVGLLTMSVDLSSFVATGQDSSGSVSPTVGPMMGPLTPTPSAASPPPPPPPLPTASPSTASPTTSSLPTVPPSTAPPTTAPPSASPMMSVPPTQSLEPSTFPTDRMTETPTKSPVSSTSSPTKSPTITPSTNPTISLSPTNTPPTSTPSSNPSDSQVPSSPPSLIPTATPTLSMRPTLSPSISAKPSEEPTLSPSLPPSIAPSYRPSAKETTIVQHTIVHNMGVEPNENFTTPEEGIYCLQLEKYTANFGYNISKPYIESLCTVVTQTLTTAGDGPTRRSLRDLRGDRGGQPSRFGHTGARGRILQTQAVGTLIVSFTMEYTSRFPTFNISDYPEQFVRYVATNPGKVVADLGGKFGLPVVASKNIWIKQSAAPTVGPTNIPSVIKLSSMPSFFPSNYPSISPSSTPSAGPSSDPSTNPTTVPSSAYPSAAPSEQPITGGTQVSDVLIAVVAGGLGGAVLVLLLFALFIRRRKRRRAKTAENPSTAATVAQAGGETQQNHRHVKAANGVSMNNTDVETGGQGQREAWTDELRENSYHEPLSAEKQQSYDHPYNSTPTARDVTGDSMLSNPSMVSGMGSIGSDPDEPNRREPGLNVLQVEFENHKKEAMGLITSGLGDTTDTPQRDMGLAIENALMEDELDVDTSWGMAEDLITIEANCLYETNDWRRKYEIHTTAERDIFFQGMMNKMAATVQSGRVDPNDGSQIIHCCAAMLGLKLVKDLPDNILIVQGMKKEIDLTRGRTYLEEAFRDYGEIDYVSIATTNRGFGFVRFKDSEAIDSAFERYNTAEIEVQDVSVTIKTLR